MTRRQEARDWPLYAAGVLVVVATIIASCQGTLVYSQEDMPQRGETTLTWDLYDEAGEGIDGYRLVWDAGIYGAGTTWVPLGDALAVVVVPRPDPLPACCLELPGPPEGCQCADITELHRWPLAISPLALLTPTPPIAGGAAVEYRLRACRAGPPEVCSGLSNAVVMLWPNICEWTTMEEFGLCAQDVGGLP